MLNEAEKHGWDAIDAEAVKAGGYLVTPKHPLIIEYYYRAMTEYCRKNGISKMDLTDKIGQFQPFILTDRFWSFCQTFFSPTASGPLDKPDPTP